MDVYRRLLRSRGPAGWWPGDGAFEVCVGAILVQNTAWVNGAGTATGTVGNQYTQVGEDDVRPGRVRITLPDNRTGIDLKVGQRYDVQTRQVHDLAEGAREAPADGVTVPAP